MHRVFVSTSRQLRLRACQPLSRLSHSCRSSSSIYSSPHSENAKGSSSKTTAALLAGLALASSQLLADEEVPAFHPKKTRYDETTYEGRVKAMRLVLDPSTLLVDKDGLEKAQALLASFNEKKTYSQHEHKQFWEAKHIVTGILHPVTGEEMVTIGRMSAFVPVNVPVAAGMLSASTPMTVAFWQWTNQSINVACNYANRGGAEIGIMDCRMQGNKSIFNKGFSNI